MSLLRANRDGTATRAEMNRLHLTGSKISAGTACFLVVLVLAVAYRVTLMVHHVPPANSDEATAGLAALHISEGRHWPIWFYGQQYMGTAHSYLAAPLIALFGPEWWALRTPALVMYMAFLTLTYVLTKRLYNPWFAVFVAGVLALGSDRVIKNQVIGAGGYSDVAAATAALMLLAVLLTARPPSSRLVVYAALWGVVAGYITWTHWLALPYVGVSAALLLVGTQRQLLPRVGMIGAAGFFVGAAPLIWHNLFSGKKNSVAVLMSLNGSGGTASWLDRLDGGILLGLPLSSGVCAPSECHLWQRWWGPVYILLLVLAVALAAQSALRINPLERAQSSARLALAVGGGLTLVAYCTSTLSAVSPIESARYLHYALVSLPSVLWPAWRALTVLCGRAAGRKDRALSAPLALIGSGVLIGFVASAVIASGQLIAERSKYASMAEQERRLVVYLEEHDLHFVYSEYWTCNRLAYLTRENVKCAVLNDDLRPGLDRYAPYRAAVDRAASVAYVMPVGSAADNALRDRVTRLSRPVRTEKVAGYAIYQSTGEQGLD